MSTENSIADMIGSRHKVFTPKNIDDLNEAYYRDYKGSTSGYVSGDGVGVDIDVYREMVSTTLDHDRKDLFERVKAAFLTLKPGQQIIFRPLNQKIYGIMQSDVMSLNILAGVEPVPEEYKTIFIRIDGTDGLVWKQIDVYTPVDFMVKTIIEESI